MFLTLGLQFQVWNLENSFQIGKNIHFTVQNVCFWLWGFNFRFGTLKFHPKIEKTYILQCKMYVFDSGASISGLEPWNFIPKLKKHTFYSVKCMFFTQLAWSKHVFSQNKPWAKNIHFIVSHVCFWLWGFNFKLGNLKISFLWGLNSRFGTLKFHSKIGTSVKCMFLTLELQFQVWNLEISFQNWKKHTFYSVKCMFLTLGLQFQTWKS